MNSLPLSPAIIGGESCSFVSGSHINLRKTSLAADLQRGPFGGANGALLKHLGQFTTTSWCRFSVFARVRKGQKHEYPWPDDVDPNLKSGHLSYLSHFKPLTDKPKPVTLPFEKPLVDLEKKIIGVYFGIQMMEFGLDHSMHHIATGWHHIIELEKFTRLQLDIIRTS